MKDLIFFSNSFGYGPTGKLIPVFEIFSRKLKNCNLYFACKNATREIFDERKFKKIRPIFVDERNINSIKKLLCGFNFPYVISSLNRFAIKAAHDLRIKTALIDSLAWFWTKQPAYYELADNYFYMNPFMLPIQQPLVKKSYRIPSIVGNVKKTKEKKYLTFFLGGGENPFYEGINKEYFRLATELLNGLKIPNEKKLFITSGSKGVNFLRKHLKKKYRTHMLSYHKHINLINKSSKFITTAGMTSTFQSINYKIPTSLYLPQNLSQWKLGNLLSNKMNFKCIKWENYFKIQNIFNGSEKQAISYISFLSHKALNDGRILESMKKDLQSLVDLKQGALKYEKAKIGGEKVIFSILRRNWGLS